MRAVVAVQAGRQRGMGMLSLAPLLPGGKGSWTPKALSSCWSRKKGREESFGKEGGGDSDVACPMSTAQTCPCELSAEVLQLGHS